MLLIGRCIYNTLLLHLVNRHIWTYLNSNPLSHWWFQLRLSLYFRGGNWPLLQSQKSEDPFWISSSRIRIYGTNSLPLSCMFVPCQLHPRSKVQVRQERAFSQVRFTRSEHSQVRIPRSERQSWNPDVLREWKNERMNEMSYESERT